MADTQQGGLTYVELTDEEKAVLRECRINSVYFRGFPLGAVSVLLLRQAVNTGYLPHVKRFSGLYYTGLFGLGFMLGVGSYQNACVEKIMKLENSRLADQVRAKQMAGHRGSYPGQWETGNVNREHQDVDLQGKGWSSNQFTERSRRPPAEDYIPPSETAPSTDESSEEAPAPPSLYFDVEKAEENKYTTYVELRKKHRERWVPPNTPPSGTSRSEQPRHRKEGESDSRTGSSDAPLSWFDMDNSNDERGSQESYRETGQRSYNRPSYRQGPPPKKNKYGDIIEG